MSNDKKTILHADDVARWRDHVVNLFSPAYDVVSVEDCDAVLPRVEQGGIDLVILDHLMPGDDSLGTGFDVGRQLKKDHPSLPVILYTGAWQGVQVDRDELEQKVRVPVVFKEMIDSQKDDLLAIAQRLLGE